MDLTAPPALPPFGIGIIGTGMIAGVVARALTQSQGVQFRAVSSRKLTTAQAFAADFSGVEAVEGVQALLQRDDVHGVYLATPTMVREAIALEVIAAGKHLLIEKPFVDAASVRRITEAAAAAGLLCMDATHFVHHPRTRTVRERLPELLGEPRSLHTAFYFPLDDPDNIRFRPDQEPMTAFGDMGWYAMRAIVEYLRPEGTVKDARLSVTHDARTGGTVQASGLISFTSGEASTFDVGYTAGTVLMDLQLLGTRGVLSMDDFVLDWNSSWSFRNQGIPAGFFMRSGMGNRGDIAFHDTPSPVGQEVKMVEAFAKVAREGDAKARAAWAEATLRTQEYLDALWATRTGS